MATGAMISSWATHHKRWIAAIKSRPSHVRAIAGKGAALVMPVGQPSILPGRMRDIRLVRSHGRPSIRKAAALSLRASVTTKDR